MNPLLRSTRRFTVAGLAAGTLVTAGLVGQLATHHDGSGSGTTVPTQPATASSGSTSSPAASSAPTSSKSTSFSQVPSVGSGGSGGSDSNSRGS